MFYLENEDPPPPLRSLSPSLQPQSSPPPSACVRLKSASESDLTLDATSEEPVVFTFSPAPSNNHKNRSMELPLLLAGSVALAAAGGTDSQPLMTEVKQKASTLPRSLKPLNGSSSSSGGNLFSKSPSVVRRPLAAVKNLGHEAETGLRNGLRAVSSAGKRLTDTLRPSQRADAQLPRSWLMPVAQHPLDQRHHHHHRRSSEAASDLLSQLHVPAAVVAYRRGDAVTPAVSNPSPGDGVGVAEVKESTRYTHMVVDCCCVPSVVDCVLGSWLV